MRGVVVDDAVHAAGVEAWGDRMPSCPPSPPLVLPRKVRKVVERRTITRSGGLAEGRNTFASNRFSCADAGLASTAAETAARSESAVRFTGATVEELRGLRQGGPRGRRSNGALLPERHRFLARAAPPLVRAASLCRLPDVLRMITRLTLAAGLALCLGLGLFRSGAGAVERSRPTPAAATVRLYCIAECTASLPTPDFGFEFWNCVNDCMRRRGVTP
jgi:hypothetical protein